MGDYIELAKALVPLAWPIIAILVFIRLSPLIASIAQSRAFTVKVGSMEVSVQDATQQIQAQIADLQKQVIALKPPVAAESSKAPEIIAPTAPAATSKTVLWVDDTPSNNAFEVAQLQNMGLQVISAKSTNEAMDALANHPDVDAIISDMGRTEDGRYHSQAGIILLEALRAAAIKTPFIVYTTSKYAHQNDARVKAAKGDGATSSPVELLEWLRNKTSPTAN